ncbi:MAG: hypothetical protein IKZ98_08735 [Clostridia bacterium]|nr:hypothetical protein [Clostridia bacterium]
MRKGLRGAAFVMVLVLALCCTVSAPGEGQKYQIEENTGDNQKNYPYKVVTESAVLYLGKADIELLGEEAFYDGMYKLLENMDRDFADAQEALKGFLKGEVAPIPIYTDFIGRAEEAQLYSGYYYGPERGIRLFHDWEQAASVLLHEYTHYLTYGCATVEVTAGAWGECIAEYISRIACRNYTARAWHYGLMEEEKTVFAANGWVDEEGYPDYRVYYHGVAWMFGQPLAIGTHYMAVCDNTMTMTKEQQEHPMINSISEPEGGCFMDFLVGRFGKDLVFTHLNVDGKGILETYGKSFTELFAEWKQENAKLCEEWGITSLVNGQ